MAEEPCQCSDCKRFYKEHDRLIREFPTFKQQQELNWASIQSFRTLCSKVTNELQRQLSEKESNEDKSSEEQHICLLYTSPSPRDRTRSRMPSSA